MSDIPAERSGESLFCDFAVTLGFDNHGDRPPLTLMRWTCRLCEREGQGSYDDMEWHAELHVASAASAVGDGSQVFSSIPAALPGCGESGEGVRPRDPLTANSEKEGD